MDMYEKQQIAERLAADLERREIKPHWINHGLIDNPYIYDGKPIARKYIYYIAKGQKLNEIKTTTFLKVRSVLNDKKKIREIKIIVTLFTCNDGHFEIFNPEIDAEKLKQKIKEEVAAIEGDFLLDNDSSLKELEEANISELIEICHKISQRGFLQVKKVCVL